MVDWFTGGRMGRGECWSFTRLESCNKVYVGDELVYWEPLVLDNNNKGHGGNGHSNDGDDGEGVGARMGPWCCVASVVVIGSKLVQVQERIHSGQVSQVARGRGRTDLGKSSELI